MIFLIEKKKKEKVKKIFFVLRKSNLRVLKALFITIKIITSFPYSLPILFIGDGIPLISRYHAENENILYYHISSILFA